MKTIRIKYFSDEYPRLEKLDVGNWIDLRVDSLISAKRKSPLSDDVVKPIKPDTLSFQAGDVLFFGLGVAMELPKGYEAYIVPRSSTFKNTGFILTNHFAVIDEVYAGDNDEWKAMVYCTKDGTINRHDRLFQFRIQEKMPEIEFEEVEHLGNKDRGGYGSTGIA